MKYNHCEIHAPEYHTDQINVMGRIENGELIYLK